MMIWKNVLNSVMNAITAPFIITTDANAHHVSWGSNDSDRRGKIIDNWVTNNGLIILNNGEPTYISNSGTFTHIDLTIASADIAVDLNWAPQSETYNSDHYPIVINSNFSSPIPHRAPRWQLQSADWDKYSRVLKMPVTFLSPTQACGAVESAIKSAASLCVRQCNTNPRADRCKNWWTKQCTEAHNDKKKALNKYKNHQGDLNLWIEYKKARARMRYVFKQAKKVEFNNYAAGVSSTVTSGEVWKKIKSINNNVNNKTIILKNNDKVIHNEKDVTEVLVKHYSMCSGEVTSDSFFNARKLLLNDPVNFENRRYVWYNVDFELNELTRALHAAKSTSPGPDFIPSDFLKNMNMECQILLLNFYNYIWNSGFPRQWSESIIVPVLKYGKIATEPKSYRPIALTNCMCKILEKMVNHRLMCYLESKQHLCSYQSGFRSGHSTLDALCRLETDVRLTLIRGEICVSIFLDFTSAFDVMWHNGLLLRLQELGLHGNLPNFIKGFLTDRRIAVRINNTLSAWRAISAGSPQGSVLSPTLFILMINDLFKGFPSGIKYSLFADDAAMWIVGPDMSTIIPVLQVALRGVEEWCHRWGLQISNQKTKAMIFTKKKVHNAASLLRLNNEDIEFVKTHRFLGMVLDRQLTWAPHISQLKETCQKDLRVLAVLASKRWAVNADTLRKIYTALIRSKLEYGGFLLASAAKTHTQKLQRIQYAGARLMLGALRCTNTNKLEAEANIPPLDLVWRENMVKYATRVLCIDNHPVSKLIYDYYPYQFYYHRKMPLPCVGNIYDEFKCLNMTYKQIAEVKLVSQYKLYNSPCFLAATQL